VRDAFGHRLTADGADDGVGVSVSIEIHMADSQIVDVEPHVGVERASQYAAALTSREAVVVGQRSECRQTTDGTSGVDELENRRAVDPNLAKRASRVP
jgi:hypothetical protein